MSNAALSSKAFFIAPIAVESAVTEAWKSASDFSISAVVVPAGQPFALIAVSSARRSASGPVPSLPMAAITPARRLSSASSGPVLDAMASDTAFAFSARATSASASGFIAWNAFSPLARSAILSALS